MKIFFVGIHNKLGLKPLDSSTKSGKLIDRIISNLNGEECIKTNLFDCNEIPCQEIKKFQKSWIKKYNPKDEDIIILLGNNTQKLFPKNICKRIIGVKHPSIIWSNKNKKKYIRNTLEKINSLSL
jgi:hypothetical protein